MFGRLQREAKAIIRSALELAWWSRGSLQYHDVLEMTYGERDEFSEFISERLEKLKGSPHPVY